MTTGETVFQSADRGTEQLDTMFELQLLLTSAFGSTEIQITSVRQHRATGSAFVLSASLGYESEISRHRCFFSRNESDIALGIQDDSKEKSILYRCITA